MDDSGLSVVALLLKLCQQGSGGELVRHQIMDGLSDRTVGQDRFEARSLVFWLAMLELFDGSPDALNEVQRAVGFWVEQRPMTIGILPLTEIVQLTEDQPPFMIVSTADLNDEGGGEVDLLQVTRRQILSEAFPFVPEVELLQMAELFVAIGQRRWVRVDCTSVSRKGLTFQALTLILDTCLVAPHPGKAEVLEPGDRDIDVAIRAVECFVGPNGDIAKLEALTYLDSIVPSFSCTKLAVLAFQLCYRVARRIDQFDKSAIANVGDVTRLGILEAIASSSAAGAERQQWRGDFVAEISLGCRRRAEVSGIDDYVLMAYDISMKYRDRTSFPRSAAQSLLAFGTEHGLEATADYFHGSSDEEVLAASRPPGEVFERWRRLRACLLDLERSTPREYRRERVSVASEQRVETS